MYQVSNRRDTHSGYYVTVVHRCSRRFQVVSWPNLTLLHTQTGYTLKPPNRDTGLRHGWVRRGRLSMISTAGTSYQATIYIVSQIKINRIKGAPTMCSDAGLDIGYVPAGPDAFFRWSGQFGPQQRRASRFFFFFLPFIFEKCYEGGSWIILL